jgi:uncharacterized protein YdeI (YjbR/CyaY-like superfamily)
MREFDPSRLRRPVYPIPDDVRAALAERGLMERYRARPACQQNDYIGWITRAKQPATRQKRLDQMLGELAGGVKYMNMDYHGK